MMLLARSVVTGFGLALGAALFKKHVQKRLGLEDDTPDKDLEETLEGDGATDPGLQHA